MWVCVYAANSSQRGNGRQRYWGMSAKVLLDCTSHQLLPPKTTASKQQPLWHKLSSKITENSSSTHHALPQGCSLHAWQAVKTLLLQRTCCMLV
jgi:hypothetical protein